MLTLKIERLGGGRVAYGEGMELTDRPFYSGFSFGLVPLNPPAIPVSLRDICVLLESKWLSVRGCWSPRP